MLPLLKETSWNTFILESVKEDTHFAIILRKIVLLEILLQGGEKKSEFKSLKDWELSPTVSEY